MSHLDDAVLLQVRDRVDGPLPPGLEAHLEGCDPCRQRLATARERAARVDEALKSLDTDWDLEAARAAVRARVSDAAAATDPAVTSLHARKRRGPGSLGRVAAALVLVAGGVSAAIPGSPVRAWLAERVAPVSVEESAEARPPAEASVGAAGIRMAVEAGPVTVALAGLEAGAELEVRWVPVREVAVFAPSGSRYASADGRVEATVARGPVRIDLPVGIRPVTLTVDGRTWLRATDGGQAIPGPVVERDSARVRFVVP